MLLWLMIIVIAVLGYLLWTRHHAGNKPAAPGPAHIVMPMAPVAVPVAAPANVETGEFDDGLRNPASITEHQLADGDEGITRVAVYSIDINGDGVNDRITKSTFENGTAHWHYQYKIELNLNGGFVDITPDDFRTVQGADCALQKIRFVFRPVFQAIKISRPWADTWVTPTMASQTVYVLDENQLKVLSAKPMREICDVSELF